MVGTHAAQSANLGPRGQRRQRRTLSPGPSTRPGLVGSQWPPSEAGQPEAWTPGGGPPSPTPRTPGHIRARGRGHQRGHAEKRSLGPRRERSGLKPTVGQKPRQPAPSPARPACPEPGEESGLAPGQAHLRQHPGAPRGQTWALPSSPEPPPLMGQGAAPLACPASHTSAQGWQKHKNGSLPIPLNENQERKKHSHGFRAPNILLLNRLLEDGARRGERRPARHGACLGRTGQSGRTRGTRSLHYLLSDPEQVWVNPS